MKVLRVGDWTVYPGLNRIARDSEIKQIEPLLMKVLEYLVARPGEPIPRTELLDEVWGGVIVGEEALTRAVSELRRVLGDDAKTPRYIETIRQGGYRLVAEVAAVSHGTPAVEGDASASLTIVREPKRRWQVLAALGLTTIGAVVLMRLLSQGNGGDNLPARHPLVLPLTAYQGLETDPALSPDGTMVAFSWRGEEGGDADIYVKQIAEEKPLRLTDFPGDEVAPAWSDTGRELAFVRRKEEGDSIFTVPIVGGSPRRVTTPSWHIGSLDWSPGGRHIVFSEMTGPEVPDRLSLLDLETGECRPLMRENVPDGGDRTPAFSPNGREVAFVRTRAYGFRDVFIVSSEGGSPRRVTRGLLGGGGLDWVDEGSLICSALVNAEFSLWKVNVGNGSLEQVPFVGGGALSPTVSRDGNRMAFQRFRSDVNIWRIRRESALGTTVRIDRLVASTYWDEDPSVSPDGARLAFVSWRSGNLEIWTANIDGSGALRLTDFKGCSVARPRWSPDGRAIAFVASPDGVGDVFFIAVDGGAPQRLTHAESNNIVSGWSHDSQWIYFSSRGGGERQIWRIRRDSPGMGNAQRVTSSGVMGVESTEGRYLYYARSNATGLWRKTVNGEGEEDIKVLEDLPTIENWGNWALCDEGIFLVRSEEQGAELVLFRFATGTIEPITRVPGMVSPSLSASRNGQILVYAQLDETDSDLILVDGFR